MTGQCIHDEEPAKQQRLCLSPLFRPVIGAVDIYHYIDLQTSSVPCSKGVSE
jgi:hypothetical protein